MGHKSSSTPAAAAPAAAPAPSADAPAITRFTRQAPAADAPAAAADAPSLVPQDASAPFDTGGDGSVSATAQAAYQKVLADRQAEQAAAVAPVQRKGAGPSLDDLPTAVLADAPARVDVQAVLTTMTPEQRAVVAMLQKDYTQKTQAVARERGELAAQRQAVFNSEAFKSLQATAASVAPDAEFDPLDPQAMMRAIEAKVAAQLLSVYKPVAEQAVEAQQEAELQAFMAQHPQIKTNQALRVEIARLLDAHEQLDLPMAFELAEARLSRNQATTQAQELAAYRKAAQQAGLRLSTGTRSAGKAAPPPHLKTAQEIYNWQLANNR